MTRAYRGFGIILFVLSCLPFKEFVAYLTPILEKML